MLGEEHVSKRALQVMARNARETAGRCDAISRSISVGRFRSNDSWLLFFLKYDVAKHRALAHTLWIEVE